MSQAVGIVEIIWRGQNVPIQEKAKIEMGSMRNAAIVAGKRVHYARTFKEGKVTAKTVLLRGQKIGDVWDVGEGELQVLTDIGLSIIFDQAFLTNGPSFTAEEGGEVELEWAVGEGREILN